MRGLLRSLHHAHRHPHSQKRTALVMIYTGLGRVTVWLALLTLYLAHVSFARGLFASVAFVSVLSVLALALTDWGQVASSLAQLTAGDAHDAASQARTALQLDIKQLDEDVGQLAALEPGPEAKALADEIKRRLGAP